MSPRHDIGARGAFDLPPGAQLVSEIAYGTDPAQTYDLYLPSEAQGAPIFVMVHGGGWSRGDKALWRTVRNKVELWVGRGYALASVNYRMLPGARPLAQADDVACALAHLQRHASHWGADPTRMVLVGHSSGAHLAALIATDEQIARRAGAAPCSGTIAIDSAAFDIVEIMRRPHLGLYDRAFGSDPGTWRDASPLHRLSGRLGAPMLIVCSSPRADSCAQAEAFAARARAASSEVTVLPVDLAHGELNDALGVPGAYTDAVVAFMRSLGLP